jgi:hemoglobin
VTDVDRIGGEERLALILDDFVDRMAKDFIIGWLFEGRDLARIKTHELGFASAHLGGGRRYEGRPLGRVHQPLAINRGMFQRRLALLATVLRDHEVGEDIIERWLAHDRRLEPVVTDGTDCAPPTTDD